MSHVITTVVGAHLVAIAVAVSARAAQLDCRRLPASIQLSPITRRGCGIAGPADRRSAQIGRGHHEPV